MLTDLIRSQLQARSKDVWLKMTMMLISSSTLLVHFIPCHKQADSVITSNVLFIDIIVIQTQKKLPELSKRLH